MSIRQDRRYHVVCDGCGEDFYDPDSDSAMGARITAGVKGWRYLQSRGGPERPVKRSAFDFCPACEPKLPGPEVVEALNSIDPGATS